MAMCHANGMSQLNFTPRAGHRIFKIAPSIGGLDGQEDSPSQDIPEAIQGRTLEGKRRA